MKTIRLQIGVTMVLGLIAMLAGVFAHLALTDIYHGEADVTLEWRVLQIAAVIIVTFIAAALFTLGRVWRALARAA